MLAAVVVAVPHLGARADAARLDVGSDATVGGVLQAAGLLFFAFAGYARIATLGEEVRDPARTIPRAIPIALGITLVVYAAVAVAVLTVLGPEGLADAAAPLADAVRAAGVPTGWCPVVRVGAAVAALGSLLALILGVSRTTLAMARDRHLPHALAAVHPRFQVPHRAELAVGAVVAVLAATADVRGAIGFSSFGVLVYYAIANASAWTLTPAEGRPPAHRPGSRPGRLPGAGLRPAADLGHLGDRGAGRRRRRLRGPPRRRRPQAVQPSPVSRESVELARRAGQSQPTEGRADQPHHRATIGPAAPVAGADAAVGGGHDQPAEGHGDQPCHRATVAPSPPVPVPKRPAGRARASPPMTTPISPTSAATTGPESPGAHGVNTPGWRDDRLDRDVARPRVRQAQIGLT